MSRLLREPLLHFLLFGALLFGAYGWLNRDALQAPDEIVVDKGRLDSLSAQFERVWQRPPSAQELNGLIQTFVREETLYREGLAMGLDRDDAVVRRRIGQKMAFIADGQASTAPTDAELQAWLDAHPDTYRIEPTYTLRQVYFDPARHGDRLEADIAAARAALERGKGQAPGDVTLLPASLDAAPVSEVVRSFGSDFAKAVAALPVGGWRGPVRSGYGVHLVELRSREIGRVPTLDEVRPAVQRDLLLARTVDANEAYYRKLRERYTVRIEASLADGTPASVAAKTP